MSSVTKSSESIIKETNFSHAWCFQCSWRMGFLLVALLAVVTGLIWGQTAISEETGAGDGLSDNIITENGCSADPKVGKPGSASNPWSCKELTVQELREDESGDGVKKFLDNLEVHIKGYLKENKIEDDQFACVTLKSDGTFQEILDKKHSWERWEKRSSWNYYYYYYWMLWKWPEGAEGDWPILHEEHQKHWFGGISKIYHKLLCTTKTDGKVFWKLSNGEYFGCWRKSEEKNCAAFRATNSLRTLYLH